MSYPGFVPFTGFDPMDGDDPRFTLSHDNPVRIPPLDARQRDTCGNQPRGLTDRDCAVRGGVKAGSTHFEKGL